jgi:hypothetical protein
LRGRRAFGSKEIHGGLIEFEGRFHPLASLFGAGWSMRQPTLPSRSR